MLVVGTRDPADDRVVGGDKGFEWKFWVEGVRSAVLDACEGCAREE